MEFADVVVKDMLSNTYAGGISSAILEHTKGQAARIHLDVTLVTTAIKTISAVDTNSEQLTVTAHGYKTGQAVQLTTTGTVPGGTIKDTTYYVILNDGNTIQLATTRANADNSVAMNLSSAGTGTNSIQPLTLTACYVWLQACLDTATALGLTSTSNWKDVAGSTLTVTNTVFNSWNPINHAAQGHRLIMTLTGGQISMTATGRSIGFK